MQCSVPSTPNTHQSPGTASWTGERGRTWRTSPLVSVFHWRSHFSAKTERTSCFLSCNLQTRGVSEPGTNCALLPQHAPVWRQWSWSSAANQQPSVKLTCGHELPIAVCLAQLSSIPISCWMSFKHNFQRRVTCVVVGRGQGVSDVKINQWGQRVFWHWSRRRKCFWDGQ